MTDIGRTLARLDARLKAVERSARLSSASLDNTALEVRDDAGSLRGIVGQQPDGTTAVNVVNGPVPPVPSLPVVDPALAALTVTWDGGFADAVAAPLDWMRCEVHVGATAGFAPDQSTLRDTIETPQGGMVTVPLPYTEWYVKLRSRTSSGSVSDPTVGVAGTPRKAETADLTAGIITADLIAVDALTGKTITGGTVTGATVQTAEAGARIVMDTNHLVVRDTADNIVAEIDPSDGFGRSMFAAYTTIGSAEYYAALTAGTLRFGITGVTNTPSEEGFLDFNNPSGLPGDYEVAIVSGRAADRAPAEIHMYSETAAQDDSSITIRADDVSVVGALSVLETRFTTYTPVVTGGGSATYSSRTGWYYKLGKMVYFCADITVGAAGSGTTKINITAPTAIDRTTRQQVSAACRSVVVNTMGSNGNAIANKTVSGTVWDEIVVSTDSPSNRDLILNGGMLLAGATITLQGWYREA